MKKIIISVCVAVMSLTGLSAQTTWGVKAGFNSSSYKLGLEDISMKINPGMKAGFYVGGVNNIALGDQTSLQTELMYAWEGSRFAIKGKAFEGADISKLAASLNFHNVRLPIMIKYQTLEGLSVLGGIYLSYTAAVGVGLSKDVKDIYNGMRDWYEELPSINSITDRMADIVKDNMNRFDLGLSIGAEYQFSDHFFIDARYSLSFLNGLKKDFKYEIDGVTEKGNWEDEIGLRPKMKYSSFQVGLGYRF